MDLYSPPVPVPDYLALDTPLPKLKVGWSATAGVPVEPEVQRAVEGAAAALGELGLDIQPVEIPALTEKDAVAISSIIFLAEAKRYSAPTISGRESELTPLFRARYVDSPGSTLEEYLDAADQWEDLRQGVKEYFTGYDLFLCPTVPMTAFPHGQREFHIGGQTLAARHTLRITLPWDLTGSPAISVPIRLEQRGTSHRGATGGAPFRRNDPVAGGSRFGGPPTGATTSTYRLRSAEMGRFIQSVHV